MKHIVVDASPTPQYGRPLAAMVLAAMVLAAMVLAALFCSGCNPNFITPGFSTGVADANETSAPDTQTQSIPPAQSPPPPVSRVQSGWSGIIGNGQSLSVGFFAGLAASTAPAIGGMRLADDSNTYDIADPSNANLHIVALSEPFRTQPANRTTAAYPYPNNIAGQTPHASMATQISRLAQQDGFAEFIKLHSAVGIGGQPMSAVARGGTQNSYAASLFEARALSALAQAQNQTLHYDAVIFTHGEVDSTNNNAHYAEDLFALQQA